MVFVDRIDAGNKLAKKLKKYTGQNGIVLALPRGGVVVGYAVAKALHFPLDVLAVRKIGAPGSPELAVGAIARQGRFFDRMLIRQLGITDQQLQQLISESAQELVRREKIYRDHYPFPDLRKKYVILVDDGAATGATARAAIAAVAHHNPAVLILALPVAPQEVVRELQSLVDVLICLIQDKEFASVGSYYTYFPQVSDEEVITLWKQRN